MIGEIKTKKIEVGVKSGAAVSFGCVVAITLSWSANHAIGWACIHGLFSWFYVVYYLVTKDGWTWF